MNGEIKTHVYVAEVCWRADTPAASAASDLRVQLAGSTDLVDPKNDDKKRGCGSVDLRVTTFVLQNGLSMRHCPHWAIKNTMSQTWITNRLTEYGNILSTSHWYIVPLLVFNWTRNFPRRPSKLRRGNIEPVKTKCAWLLVYNACVLTSRCVIRSLVNTATTTPNISQNSCTNWLTPQQNCEEIG